MAYQTLYRRYRPRRFSDVRGQEHVIRALRNAVQEERVGHAYLFSGPRGTGKTSTARILAKALNCEHLDAGEPDGTCESCLAIDAGTSYDVQELDAASNNKVEDIRDLIGRVALGSPGRTKVYILDEVHMLTPSASASLLKTLEEPPPHVVFVLATTDPQKVLDTIRSRTQHFEFHLLSAEELTEHVAWVMHDAGLDLPDGVIEHVVRQGRGSARDTLSALDQVSAAGGVPVQVDALGDLLDAIATADAGKALLAVADAVSSGRDPRVLGESVLARLRDVFLVRMGASVTHLPAGEIEQVRAWASQLNDRATTRALEAVGDALLEMRQAPDPRIPLEVAMVKLARVDTDPTLDALTARVERLEAALEFAGSGDNEQAAGRSPAGRDRSPDPSGTAEGPAKPTDHPAAGAADAAPGALVTTEAWASTASANTAMPPSTPMPAAQMPPAPTPVPAPAGPAREVAASSAITTGDTTSAPAPSAGSIRSPTDLASESRVEGPSAPGSRPADVARAKLASHRQARAAAGGTTARPAQAIQPAPRSGPPPPSPSASSPSSGPRSEPGGRSPSLDPAPTIPPEPGDSMSEKGGGPESVGASGSPHDEMSAAEGRPLSQDAAGADSPGLGHATLETDASAERPDASASVLDDTAGTSSSATAADSLEPPSSSGGASRVPAAGPVLPKSGPTPDDGLDAESLGVLWEETVLPALGGLARAMFASGHVVEVDGAVVVFALPNEMHREKCERKRAEVELAFADGVGSPVTLRLVAVEESTAPSDDAPSGSADRSESSPNDVDDLDDLDGSDVHDLEDAADAPKGGLDLLLKTFDGAELVDET